MSVKQYVFNTQNSHFENWRPVVMDHLDAVNELREYILSMIHNAMIVLKIPIWLRGFALKIFKSITWLLCWWNRPAHWSEIDAISKLCEIDFYYVLWMQFLYELNAACSTVVFEHQKQVFVMSTMDWEMPLLKKLTIQLQMMDGDRYLYEATT